MILVELGLFVLVAAAGLGGGYFALTGTLSAAAARGQTADPGPVLQAGQEALGWWAGGVLLLALARLLASRRAGRHLPVPFLLPSAMAATGLGLAVQLGYGDPFRAAWPGPDFAFGTFLAAAVGAVILLVPWDPPTLLSRFHIPVGLAGLGLFVALAVFGDAPGSSDQRINLGPVQPIELVKVLAVAFIAEELGRRAGKLRWHRTRAAGFVIPRPTVLLPAVVALCATLLGLLAVKDIGPTLILSAVFVGLFFVVTRAAGPVLVAGGAVLLLIAALAWRPELAMSSTVETRLHMWLDPFLNGLPNGDQLALARWALAAGGLFGLGLGGAEPAALPAGHTDLVYAHLVEELGLAGGVLYLVLLGVTVVAALEVGARNRTPERALLGAGLGLLLAAQAFVILGGTLGALPLTGVVVPFLSYGKSSMTAFVAVVALVARLAENGAPTKDTDELRELRATSRIAAGIAVAAGAVVALLTAVPAVLLRDATTLTPAVTTLADGTPTLLLDPRLEHIAGQIRRGSILDRNGQPIAASPHPGTRILPLGDALGTVLGPADGSLLRAKWSLERQFDTKLRGWPDLPDGPAIWLGKVKGGERVLLAVPSAAKQGPGEKTEAERQLTRRGGSGEVRRLALATPDFRPLLPLARLPVAARGPAVEALSEDVPSRSVTVSLDARVQALAARAVREGAKRSKVGAAALVVLDPATGHVLARAQWPDYDPSRTESWRALRLAGEPKFMGVYGAWSDKTGAHGVYQAGSVFKILTATVALRAGLVIPTPTQDTCPASSDPRFDCNTVLDGRTAFTLPGWSKPIHDFGDGGAKGRLDLVEGITRSSNVYFGQLALALGPTAFRELREAGVEFGNAGLLEEKESEFTGLGTANSRRLAQTGFGQGAGSWNVTQAARLFGAVANGGTYVRCPADMAVDAECQRVALLTPGASVSPILAGMRGVIDRGTGAKLPKLPGVRLYGKTGTADAPATKAEIPYGQLPGRATSPHSWFGAIAEPADAADCADGTPGRLVVVGVVPHGGFGASAAGPMVIQTLQGLQELGLLPSTAAP